MRCKNCGWPNKPNETICVKCGSPLDMEPQNGNNGSGGNYQPQAMGDSDDGLKKTVMENRVFGPSVEQPHPESPTVSETSCPKCGYPMRAGAAKCPNCNYSPSASVTPQPNNNPAQGGGYQRHPTRMAQEPAEEPILKQTRKVSPEGGGVYRGTINPYMMNYQAEPAFILQPIQRMNERKPVEAAEFEGSEINLNRDNTEPGNPTISSKNQAIVTYQDGHWYIEDKSEQKTTFVQAAHMTELHYGDIILLGNRLFEFKEQE